MKAGRTSQSPGAAAAGPVIVAGTERQRDRQPDRQRRERHGNGQPDDNGRAPRWRAAKRCRRPRRDRGRAGRAVADVAAVPPTREGWWARLRERGVVTTLAIIVTAIAGVIAADRRVGPLGGLEALEPGPAAGGDAAGRAGMAGVGGPGLRGQRTPAARWRERARHEVVQIHALQGAAARRPAAKCPWYWPWSPGAAPATARSSSPPGARSRAGPPGCGSSRPPARSNQPPREELAGLLDVSDSPPSVRAPVPTRPGRTTRAARMRRSRRGLRVTSCALP